MERTSMKNKDMVVELMHVHDDAHKLWHRAEEEGAFTGGVLQDLYDLSTWIYKLQMEVEEELDREKEFEVHEIRTVHRYLKITAVNEAEAREKWSNAGKDVVVMDVEDGESEIEYIAETERV